VPALVVIVGLQLKAHRVPHSSRGISHPEFDRRKARDAFANLLTIGGAKASHTRPADSNACLVKQRLLARGIHNHRWLAARTTKPTAGVKYAGGPHGADVRDPRTDESFSFRQLLFLRGLLHPVQASIVASHQPAIAWHEDAYNR
jgi:hypothetical protein